MTSTEASPRNEGDPASVISSSASISVGKAEEGVRKSFRQGLTMVSLFGWFLGLNDLPEKGAAKTCMGTALHSVMTSACSRQTKIRAISAVRRRRRL